MDKYSLLLSFYRGRKINKEAFDEYFSPNGISTTEYTHEVLNEWEYVVYELTATIADGIVECVNVFKIEDRDTGHGRPKTYEKSLTTSEWKQAFQIFDQCFPDQSESEVNAVVQKALQMQVSFSGYTIKKVLKNDVLFDIEDGNTVKLPRKRIKQAIQYPGIPQISKSIMNT